MGAWGSPSHIFYRLNVIGAHPPSHPLRERIEDILQLTKHFLEKNCRSMQRPIMHLDKVAVSEGLLHNFYILGCLVNQMSAGVAQRVTGDTLPFRVRFGQVTIDD